MLDFQFAFSAVIQADKADAANFDNFIERQRNELYSFCVHFKVQLENKQISVWMDGEFQYKDNLEDISIQENSKQLKLTIYGSKEKTTFIGRDIGNIFGFCRERDLSILKELAQDLHGLVK